MLGCFNPILGQMWTNPNVGLKMQFKNVSQRLDLFIFDPKLGSVEITQQQAKLN